MHVLLLIVGFVLLIGGAQFLVDAAVALAQRFRVAPAVIGLTVVAFGTSLPELVVNLFASASGQGEVAFGNVIGSNIFNVLFIVGFSAVIMPVRAYRQSLMFDMPAALFTALIALAMGFFGARAAGGQIFFSRFDGALLLVFFVIFMIVTARGAFSGDGELSHEHADAPQNEGREAQAPKHHSTGFIIAGILVGLAALIAGGRIVVFSAVAIAHALSIDERVISLTIVSIGTSLPEVAVSAVSAYKKHSSIALGNIAGSNIFNVLFIFGLSTLIDPVRVDSSALFDLLVHVASALLLFAVLLGFKKVSRPMGMLFIALYAAYAVRLFMAGGE